MALSSVDRELPLRKATGDALGAGPMPGRRAKQLRFFNVDDSNLYVAWETAYFHQLYQSRSTPTFDERGCGFVNQRVRRRMSGWIGEPHMPGFESDLKKLEDVVERLERGDLTLDDSVKLFEEGVKLSNACKAELDKAEGKIQVLVQGKRGSMQVAEMEAEDEERELGVTSGEEEEEA